MRAQHTPAVRAALSSRCPWSCAHCPCAGTALEQRACAHPARLEDVGGITASGIGAALDTMARCRPGPLDRGLLSPSGRLSASAARRPRVRRAGGPSGDPGDELPHPGLAEPLGVEQRCEGVEFGRVEDAYPARPASRSFTCSPCRPTPGALVMAHQSRARAWADRCAACRSCRVRGPVRICLSPPRTPVTGAAPVGPRGEKVGASQVHHRTRGPRPWGAGPRSLRPTNLTPALTSLLVAADDPAWSHRTGGSRVLSRSATEPPVAALRAAASAPQQPPGPR